ncbi:hypothetical protein STANM309S_03972 [Streptomyces tanashiensis]
MSGSSSGRSVQVAAQEGSRTTTGPVTSPITSNVLRITFRAAPSCPVDTYVSPQQTRPGGSSTPRPASSRTRTAAPPTSGAR